jgi:hypothetical protein
VLLPAASSRLECPGANAIEELDDVLEAVAGNALGDEDDPRPMIAVRPAVEPRHRVEEMLRALDDGRPPRFLSDIYEALDAQKACTEVLPNSVQQELRFVARKRGLACENETLNSPAFEVGPVGMAVVVVFVMVVAASVMMMRSVLMRLNVEPRARVGLRVCRVEAGR